MLIEAGVDVGDLKREIRRALGKVERKFHQIVVSSTYEGDHGGGSLHYCNDAFDIWPMSFPDNKMISVKELKNILGFDFDIVDEGNHIHIEFDPK